MFPAVRLGGERLDSDPCVPAGKRLVEVLPLPVVPDWDEQVRRASEVCQLIDRHLNYEARGRLLLELENFHPQHLCPEQRVQMISDTYGATR